MDTSTPLPQARPEGNDSERYGSELPENTVEYMLFLVEDQIESRQLLSSIENVRKTAIRMRDELTNDYIWQRDSFNLELKVQHGLMYLHGTTNYGDSIEDEWLVVYLLRELTMTFTDLWIRVSDHDGEFLLIEAAGVTPTWLNPEMDRNRVWIHDFSLYIIPLTAVADARSNTITLDQAVAVLRCNPEVLVHSTLVEAEAFYRLEKYPSQVSDALHHALVTVPRKLAYIIHARPKAIAPAAEAFYLRDPISLKPLLQTSAALVFPPEDLVTISVRFTKVLFAQFLSQRFEPPPLWNALVPQISVDGSLDDEDLPGRLSRLELGAKVTTGFELLARSAHKSESRTAREVALLIADLEEDGYQVLPSDKDIKLWPEVSREDDDLWMNINYQDFERELDGKRTEKGAEKPANGEFGNPATQTDLRKIVSRFEAFLNDESAGLDGVESDDMDVDNDEEEMHEEDSDDEDEDKPVSFDEEQFTSMMREMMGFHVDAQGEDPTEATAAASTSDDDEEIRELAAQIESELNSHGALEQNRNSVKIPGKRPRDGAASSHSPPSDSDSQASDEVDVDYNLAKNLLESFKSQSGLAGPVGNMLGAMGITLPRDDGDDEGEAGEGGGARGEGGSKRQR